MSRPVLMCFLFLSIACANSNGKPPIPDSAFAKVQERGEHVMGVDQYQARHVFETLPDGGRIVLAWPDTAGDAPPEVARIRQHMREIAGAFEAGNFSAPFAVHATVVPGTDVMRERRGAIAYTVQDVPGGAEVRIVTADPVAARGVADFLAFQRNEHRTGHAHREGM